jgi:hypothetical protein
MNKINLLYAKNVITRKAIVPEQDLSFLVLVDDLAFDKSVDVAWAGEDGVWHTLAAAYHGKAGRNQEYWLARMAFAAATDRSLPGNVQFALRYRVSGAEYWDNQQGENHSLQADSGIMLADKRPLLNVEFGRRLADGQTRCRLWWRQTLQLAGAQSHDSLDARRLAELAQVGLSLRAQLLGQRVFQQREKPQSLRLSDLEYGAEGGRGLSGSIQDLL